MAYLTRQIGFCAAHYYWCDAFSETQNRQVFRACANREGHGHNYLVEVTLEGPVDPKTGMIINFFDLDPILHQAIAVPLDHKNLNTQVPEFRHRVPTLENIVLYIWSRLAQCLPPDGPLVVARVKVIETPDLFVEYTGMNEKETPMVFLTRRYVFSAAHRLWREDFTDAENQRYFGPCSRLHGHNYTLEVSVQGPPSEQTGMIVDLVDLDALVHAQILSHVDHTCLDEDVPFLRGVLSTVENVAQCFYNRLMSQIPQPAKLCRVRLYESEASWVEITQPAVVRHQEAVA